VQTNDPTANSIQAYRRNADGSLTLSAVYPTGGAGGRELGSMSDPIASQGSLVYDQTHALVLAVNAGSNSVSVFGVQGDQLHLNQVVPSGGSFPASIDVHGDFAYVLNAGLTGTVSGFRISGGTLTPIPGSTRSLGLANFADPFFLSSPAQIGFSPSGQQLIVTTKTNSTVDVFTVAPDGQLSAAPVKNPDAPLPFPFRFGPDDLLALVTAGNSALGTFRLNPDGTISPVGVPVSDGQAAACWITPAKGFDYVGNTGSGTISQFRVSGDGSVTLVNPVAASVSGAIDMTAVGGHLLYAESGGTGIVDAFAINSDGSLSLIESVNTGEINFEGIASD
jgi:6-phosphogluconolactonase (cycloisomerase 2 family)